jgi:outer membrane protein assembly factor BamD
MRFSLICLGLFLLPYTCPAPLVYRPGEGWTYEPVSGGKWERPRAKDQLEVAQQAFEKKDYGLATKAARRVIKLWPFSDFAPDAQYLVGRCYEARHRDERAFNEYQKLIVKYPKTQHYQEVLHRQYEIANRYLAGQWFRLWGYIPVGRSMSKTAEMFEKIVKNGVHSDEAPQSQMDLGLAREKEHQYNKAVKAYETAADRYNNMDKIASDARLNIGKVYAKQAMKSEYDQSMAGKAIAAFTDFGTLFPQDPRVPEAQSKISTMRSEQALGSYKIARYYEKRHRWSGALIYYHEVLLRDPKSKQAEEAKVKIEELKNRVAPKP